MIPAKPNCPPDVPASAFALLCAVEVPLTTEADSDPEAAEAREERALLASEEIDATAEAAAELAEDAMEAALAVVLLIHVNQEIVCVVELPGSHNSWVRLGSRGGSLGSCATRDCGFGPTRSSSTTSPVPATGLRSCTPGRSN